MNLSKIVRKEILEHINKNIKPLYKNFDKAHSISHFNFVTKNCIEYGTELINQGEHVNLEIAYVVGAYHDVGIINGREGHAKSSAEYVKKDGFLKSVYNADTILLIAEAVEDHSSHLDHEPRSIYGKIVADADRNNTCYLVFSRPVKFGLKNEKQYNRKQQINRVYEFVQNKFGRNGYVKYHLNIPQTTKEQQNVWTLLDNEQLCKQYISGIIDECTKGKLK